MTMNDGDRRKRPTDRPPLHPPASPTLDLMQYSTMGWLEVVVGGVGGAQRRRWKRESTGGGSLWNEGATRGISGPSRPNLRVALSTYQSLYVPRWGG